MDLRLIPKVELHVHLDCCLSYPLVQALLPGCSFPDYLRDYVAPSCSSLMEFLSYVPKAVDLLQDERALRLLARDMVRQLVEDNVIYAEIRFAPLLHLQQGMTPEHVVEVVDEVMRAASRAAGIETRLILCTLRQFSAAQSLQTAKLVEKFRGTSVVALDLAGDEAGYPLDNHIDAFQFVASHGLSRTAHAGEATGAPTVWKTLKHLAPMRIGHGVRSVEDPELMAHLAESRVHLEVCPTSNISTGTFPRYDQHPIGKLYQSGVSLGVNTDGRGVGNITLNEEYEKVANAFQWTATDFLACNQNALAASFADAATKSALQARLRAAHA